MIAKACLRQGSLAPGNRGIATTGGEIRALRERIFGHIDMTDDELAAIASRTTLHVVK